MNIAGERPAMFRLSAALEFSYRIDLASEFEIAIIVALVSGQSISEAEFGNRDARDRALLMPE